MLHPSARAFAVAFLVLALLLVSCGDGNAPSAPAPPPSSAPAPTPAPNTAEPPLPLPAAEVALPEVLRGKVFQPFTGDLDAMIKRRIIRVGVPYNRTFYFVDQGVQRGVSFEIGRAFEDELNKKLKTTGATKVHVVFVVLPRDQLAQALTKGLVDIVAAQVTVRPELLPRVDFSNPTRKNISEVVVTGPGAPSVGSTDDLSGKEVWVRKNSSYHASLIALNTQLKARGRLPAEIRHPPGSLEDDDLLEMVNAGLIPITVVDSYLADFWKKTFTNLNVRDSVTLRTGGVLALAIRKGSPQLLAQLNASLLKFGLGTAFGNVIEKRYLESTRYAKSATSETERAKFLELVSLFEKYSGQYNVDYLLMAAQGYQESGLNQNAKSSVGAVGVMQIMPATGREQHVGDIAKLEPNIHAGVKYMRFMIDRYYKDEPMDQVNKMLFAFASYNAGPARIAQLRREAAARGLDPNVWFGNVEQIASERIGRETVTYVSNIYKYYVAYRLVLEQSAGKKQARQTVRAQVGK